MALRRRSMLKTKDINYLTFVAVESGTFSFSGEGVKYSINNGASWTTLASTASTPTVIAGQKIMWKGEMTPDASGVGGFSSSGSFNVEGNVMSLLYGDNFVGQTDLSGKDYAFDYLFSNCDVLSAENLKLPATTLSINCYEGMFESCSSLTTAPELPATTLAPSCYIDMFNGCTSLTTAPELPAETLVSSCYRSMFSGCTSLTTPPELLATELADSCYYSMFNGCTSLTTAPELPAKTLVSSCYRSMFNGCTNLNYIKCLATDISASNCTYRWVRYVSGSGTFVKPEGMNDWPLSISGIPTTWSAITESQEYLTFVAVEGGTFKYASAGTVSSVEYSVDNGTTWTALSNNTNTPTVQAGSRIMWRHSGYTSNNNGLLTFSSTNKFKVGGNIMSLYYKDDFSNKVGISGNFNFRYMFSGCTYLTDAEYLLLPATTYGTYAYDAFFKECTSLVKSPKVLPRVSLAGRDYKEMFYNCRSLVTVPDIKAETAATASFQGMFVNCVSLVNPPNLRFTSFATVSTTATCKSMFYDCTKLTKAIELPATELRTSCYEQMFRGCKLLTEAPILPATTLVENCYNGMFSGCTNLNSIVCYATDISATGCTDNWVSGVAASGTFVKPSSMTSWTIGASGIPTSWVVMNMVNYIQNVPNTNSVIDTNINPDVTDLSMEGRVQVVQGNTATTNYSIFGTIVTTSPVAKPGFYVYKRLNSGDTVCVQYLTTQAGSSYTLIGNDLTDSPSTIRIEKDSIVNGGCKIRIYKDGVLKSSPTMWYSPDYPPYNITLFDKNSNGNVVRIYYVKVFKGDGVTLTAHFVPCSRSTDSNVGFYDVVNRVFHTNNNLVSG